MGTDDIVRVVHTPKLPGLNVNQEFSAVPLNDRQQPCIFLYHLQYLQAAPLRRRFARLDEPPHNTRAAQMSLFRLSSLSTITESR